MTNTMDEQVKTLTKELIKEAEILFSIYSKVKTFSSVHDYLFEHKQPHLKRLVPIL